MSETVGTDVTYEIDPDGVNVAESVAIHHEVGDSEFDYVLVGSDPDIDGNELNAFGFHEQELPTLPLPEEDDDE